ncbi:superoxide dismutase family protein [Chryseobacterium turcicum]|uniref:Superoxide dismutase family protein n=1 Tax=Chryseobacterium turcicum TaxID=2898076 RepID=A0A9Q3YXU7_9FLAO|nr:superoxide dismutase family protein [Chryseobacterium turcicum]MCD1115455.1 superoxide dismutase family protein [Chryseobacterium turcicum]
MKLQTLTLLASCVLLAASCSSSKTYNVLAKSETKTGGTAKFTQDGNEVIMNLEVTHLTPGIHAVHIHEKGDCSAPDATSAGGHWNPSQKDHGKWGNSSFHMGDIGNLVANSEGIAKLTFKTDKWCLDCVDEQKNIIGKGIIIHADEDDFKTQPTGNAGGRVGCVEIK